MLAERKKGRNSSQNIANQVQWMMKQLKQGALDAANGNTGKGMLHETLESYEGGLISLKKGTSSPPAGQKGSVYDKAHRRAPSQGGRITGQYWDAAGNPLPNETGAKKAIMSSNGKPIMVYP